MEVSLNYLNRTAQIYLYLHAIQICFLFIDKIKKKKKKKLNHRYSPLNGLRNKTFFNILWLFYRLGDIQFMKEVMFINILYVLRLYFLQT